MENNCNVLTRDANNKLPLCLTICEEYMYRHYKYYERKQIYKIL